MVDCSGCRSVAIIDGSAHCAAPSCPRHIGHLDEFHKQLSATKEKLDEASDAARDWKNAHALLKEQFHKQRNLLEAAEKRISESQEQEPVLFAFKSDQLDECYGISSCGGAGQMPLYTMPPIPPELAELQRENAEALESNKAVWKELESVDYAGSMDAAVRYLKRENAELRNYLQRLASVEAFSLAGTIDTIRDLELIMRVDFAREALKKVSHETSEKV